MYISVRYGGAVRSCIANFASSVNTFISEPATEQTAAANAHVVSYDAVAIAWVKKNFFVENETTLRASVGQAQKHDRQAVPFLGPFTRAEQPFSEAHRGVGIHSHPQSTSRHPQRHRSKQARARRQTSVGGRRHIGTVAAADPAHAPCTPRANPVHTTFTPRAHPVNIAYAPRSHPVRTPYTPRAHTPYTPCTPQRTPRAHPARAPCTARAHS